ncbi:hypothetical protein ACFLZE_05320 [Thermodesulfobacteriota bacterium]
MELQPLAQLNFMDLAGQAHIKMDRISCNRCDALPQGGTFPMA